MSQFLGALTGRLRRPTTVEWTALALLAVTLAAIGVWLKWNAADAWMPNVATGAFFVAITVTVVDRAIRRENQRRLEPFRTRGLTEVVSEWRTLCQCVAIEYAETHNVEIETLPEGIFDRLQKWLDNEDVEASPHRLAPNGMAPLVSAGCGFAVVLRSAVDRFGVAFPDDVVLEFESFVKQIARDATDQRSEEESNRSWLLLLEVLDHHVYPLSEKPLKRAEHHFVTQRLRGRFGVRRHSVHCRA